MTAAVPQERSILLSGYFGFDNLGDELILTALLGQLRRLAPDAVPVVLSVDPARTTRRYGVRSVPRWSLWAVVRALRNADALVSGGGGLLQDETGAWTPGYYAGLMLLARRMGKTVAGWGQGIGPLGQGWNRALTRQAVRASDLFMVRDEGSRRRLAGAPGVVVGADLAFALPWRFHGRTPARDCVAVVLRGGRGAQQETALFRFLDAAARQGGIRFRFLAFQAGLDADLARECRERFPGSPVTVLLSPERTSILKAFGDASLILSMRFHGLVLASLFGRPGLGLVSGAKIDGFIREFGQETLAGLDPQTALRCLNRVRKDRAVYSRRMVKGAAQARQRLVRAEERLRSVLSRCMKQEKVPSAPEGMPEGRDHGMC